MSKDTILLIGAGGHARACIDVIEEEGRFEIAGLVGQPNEVGTVVLGYPIIGADADLPRLRRDAKSALVTVGQIKDPEPRRRLFELVERAGFAVPVVTSPRAHVSRHARVGVGTIVMHGAILNAGATVGRNCIINTRALVEHDASVGDHCHIATAAVLNGHVSIGDASFVGSNSTIRQGITIGHHCVIGMGQRILKNCGAFEHLPEARSQMTANPEHQ